MSRPSELDGLERRSDEPEGWHAREVTSDGYPLMGSSPAERQEAVERTARIKAQAMRDHSFVGDGPYCQAMLGPKTAGGPATGVITMTTRCGYPPDTHPTNIEPRFLVWSNQHEMWWRPGQSGYTGSIDEAGRYDRAEADEIVAHATCDGALAQSRINPVTGEQYKQFSEVVVLAPECQVPAA